MGDCCQNKACELSKLQNKQAKILWSVLAINGIMFLVEFSAGIRGNSLALTGDSLDMLGDTFAYGSSLYVIKRGVKAQAGAAFFKGMIMFIFAIAVFARAMMQFFGDSFPSASIIGSIGLIALFANLLCLFLLTRHRHDNINMSSVWLCSRNDIIANVSVLISAVLVALTHSKFPDLIVGLFITVVFAQSAGKVLSQSWQQLQTV